MTPDEGPAEQYQYKIFTFVARVIALLVGSAIVWALISFMEQG